jgi:hypothetical protein
MKLKITIICTIALITAAVNLKKNLVDKEK